MPWFHVCGNCGSGRQYKFAEKAATMTDIKDRDYLELAREAAAAIGRKEFFSGTIECAHEGFDSKLTATLLIYRQDDALPEGESAAVTDIVPVWWEFSLTAADGSPLANDYSFAEFREYLIDYFRTETI